MMGADRLQEREDCVLRLGHKDYERKTKVGIAEQRKQEMIDYNIKTFGAQAIGVHGKELPKFHQSAVQQWWKLHPGYNLSPTNVSRLRLTQDHKFWAKNDNMLLADTLEEEAP